MLCVTLEDVFDFKIIIPDKKTGDKFFSASNFIDDNVSNRNTENHYLSSLQDLLLQNLRNNPNHQRNEKINKCHTTPAYIIAGLSG